ncbi:titin homolog [Littorina saxatilis]|uniref:Uncharacterized protein n=1 Tax=Littorina saxatilis TaxID=31220 RepID=A0AAN9GPP3_9CAEN
MNDGTGKNVGKASKKKTPKHLRPSSSGPPPDKPQCNCAQLRAIAHAPCKQQPVDPEILRLPIPRAKGQQSSPGQQGFVPQRGDCPVHGNVLGALLTARCSEPFCTAAGPRQLKQKKKKKKKKEPYEMYTSDSEESLDSGTLQTGQIKEQKKSGLDKPSHGDTGTLQTGKIKEQKKSGLDKPSLGDTGTLQTGKIKEQKKSGLDKPSLGDTGTLQTGKIKEQKKSGLDKPSLGDTGTLQTGKIKEQKKSGLDKPSHGDTGTLQTGKIKEQKKSGLDKPSHGDTGTLQTGKIKEQKKSGLDKPSHGDTGTLQTGKIKEQKKSGLDKPSLGDTGTLQTGQIKEQKKSGLDKPSLGDTGTLQTGKIKEQKKSGLDKPSHGDTGTLQTGKIKEQKKSGIDKPSHGACGIVPDVSKLERSSVPEARESMAFSSVSSPQERPGTGTEQKSKRHRKKKNKNKLKNTSPAACATGSDASELYQPRESKAHDNPVKSSADAAEQGKRAQQTVTVTCTKAQKAPQQSSTLDGMDKRVKTAAKSLRKLQRKIDNAMKKSEDYGEQLFLGVDKLTTNRGEAEKALKDHVTQLHSLLDQHFQHHLESLRQRHKEHLQQVLITRTEEMNHQGKLAHLQREVEDLLKLVTESHDATTDPNVEVSALRTKFNQTDTQKPDAKAISLHYTAEIPQVTATGLEALAGRFVFVEDLGHQLSSCHDALTHRMPSTNKDLTTPAASEALVNNNSQDIFSDTAVLAFARSHDDDCVTSSQKEPSCAAADEAYRKLLSKVFASRSEKPVNPKPRATVAAQLESQTKFEEQPRSEKSVNSEPRANVAETLVSQTMIEEQPRPEKSAKLRPRSIVVPKGESPTILHGRSEQATDLAPGKYGTVWVVYGDRDNHLDLLDEFGNIVWSMEISEVPLFIAAIVDDDVMVMTSCPQQIKVLNTATSQYVLDLPFEDVPLQATSLSYGEAGLVVSFNSSLLWFSEEGEGGVWIVRPKTKPRLTGISSTAVMTLDGEDLIFAAVRGTHEVVIFQREGSNTFLALPSFEGCDVETGIKTFTPLSISAHPAGFLAVLDSSGCDSVVILDVRRFEVACVISGRKLCKGVPSLVAFARDGRETKNPELLVATLSGVIYRTEMTFLY